MHKEHVLISHDFNNETIVVIFLRGKFKPKTTLLKAALLLISFYEVVTSLIYVLCKVSIVSLTYHLSDNGLLYLQKLSTS